MHPKEGSSPKRPKPAPKPLDPPLFPGEPTKGNPEMAKDHPLHYTARMRRVLFKNWVFSEEGEHSWGATAKEAAEAERPRAIRPDDDEENRLKQISKAANRAAKEAERIKTNMNSDHFNCNAIFHPYDRTQEFEVAVFFAETLPKIDDTLIKVFETRGGSVTHKMYKEAKCDEIVAVLNRSFAFYKGGKHPYLVAAWDPKREVMVAREVSSGNFKEMLKQKVEFIVNKDDGTERTTVNSLTLHTIWTTHPNRREIKATVFDPRWHYDVSIFYF